MNPVKTGYSAVADEWVGIRPGTDGLFVLSLVHELLQADRIDLDFLARYTNAAWLVVRNPGGADDGLFVRNADGKPLAWDRATGAAIDAATPGMQPQIAGEISLPDGRRVLPVFHLLAERYLDGRYAPEVVAETCGIPATTIRRIAARTRRRRVRPGDHVGPAVDRYIRPTARDDARPAGGDARDARHLGAFQRLPHLPSDSSAADAAGRGRYAGVLALQVAVSEADAAGAAAGGQGGQAEYDAARHGAGQSARPGRPAAGRRRQRGAHRQGVHLGRAACRRTG